MLMSSKISCVGSYHWFDGGEVKVTNLEIQVNFFLKETISPELLDQTSSYVA